MRRKTYVEEIYESGIAKGVAQGHKKTATALINLGILTDEQIASVTEQTLEDIAELRSQITV